VTRKHRGSSDLQARVAMWWDKRAPMVMFGGLGVVTIAVVWMMR
jgi:hypothetical protein